MKVKEVLDSLSENLQEEIYSQLALALQKKDIYERGHELHDRGYLNGKIDIYHKLEGMFITMALLGLIPQRIYVGDAMHTVNGDIVGDDGIQLFYINHSDREDFYIYTGE